MIPIFRKIRKQLADKNKPVQYLRYAIGEIVLVVIGILIALQINNWNVHQNELREEKVYLKGIKNDLENQLLIIKKSKEFEMFFASDTRKVLAHYSKKGCFAQMDSIYKSINNLSVSVGFGQVNTTFQELTSSGNIGLISNVVLRGKLIIYYQGLSGFTQNIQNINTNLIDLLSTPFILKNSVYGISMFPELSRSIFGITDYKDNYGNIAKLTTISEKQLQDPSIELFTYNLVNLRLIITEFHIKSYTDMAHRTNQLLDDINSELIKR